MTEKTRAILLAIWNLKKYGFEDDEKINRREQSVETNRGKHNIIDKAFLKGKLTGGPINDVSSEDIGARIKQKIIVSRRLHYFRSDYYKKAQEWYDDLHYVADKYKVLSEFRGITRPT